MNKEKFFKKWFDKNPYENFDVIEAKKIRNSDNPYHALLRSNLQFFILDLNYDMENIVKECLNVYNNFSKNIMNKDHSNKVYWQLIYGNPEEIHNHTMQNNTKQAVWLYECSEFKKFQESFLLDKRPIWLSIIEPGGKFDVHIDSGKNRGNLTKCRCSIRFPKKCKMVIEGVGGLSFDNGQVFFFSHLKNYHGVPNFDNISKIDVSFGFDIEKSNTLELLNMSIIDTIDNLLQRY